MQNFFSRAAKVTAVLLAILFVYTTLHALLFYNIGQTAFDAELYKDALYNENIYARLPSVLGEQLVLSTGFELCVENPIACDYQNREAELDACLKDALGKEAYYSLAWNERTPTSAELQRVEPCFQQYGCPQSNAEKSDLSPFTKNLTAKDWELLIASLLPPEELQAFSEESLDQIFMYLNGKSAAAHIPLESIKQKLTSEVGMEAVLTFLRAQPDCTLGELSQLASGEIIYCNPPEEVMSFVSPILKAELANAAEKIPDQIIFPRDAASRDDLVMLQFVRLILRLSPLMVIVLLLLITLLAVRSLKSWLHWWGIPMLITGVLGLLIGLIAMPFINLNLDVLLFGQLPPEVSYSVIELGFDLLTSVIHDISETIVLQALIIAFLGLGMTVGAVFVKQESSQIS